MLTTPHVLIGAVCGIASGYACKASPSTALLVAFGCGFISHLILDLIPHHDQETYIDRKISPGYLKFFCVLDIIVGVGILLYLLHFKPWSTFHLAKWGAICGTIIDVVDNVLGQHLCPWFGRTAVGEQIHRFHEFFHTRTSPRRWILGIATQLASSFFGSISLFLL